MNKILILVIFLFGAAAFPQAGSSLVLSEIMFNTEGTSNEFVELYNSSETESVDLTGYKIKYHTAGTDLIIPLNGESLIQPKTFAVILEGDYELSTGIYENLISSAAILFKISDNSFGASGMANTSDRTIWLINPVNDTLDVYTYSANNSTFLSDEKKFLNKDSSKSNWANSLVTKGTPGFKNSVSPLLYDLDLSSIKIFPQIVFENDDIEISVTVKNNGTENLQSFVIQIFNDVNFNSIGDAGELIFSQIVGSLSAGDSLQEAHVMNSLPAGAYSIIAIVVDELDENSLNNSLTIKFNVLPPSAGFNDIIINEIMYAPSTGEPEWIELFNLSESSINLNRWRISDNSSSASLPLQDIFLQPDSFIVIARDSSIFNYFKITSKTIVTNLPALNNGGDAVVVKDSNNIVIDSIQYSPVWGGNSSGKSLERISTEGLSNDPLNWGTSVGNLKATPGKINSLSPKNYDLQIYSFKPEKSFGIVGEQLRLNLILKNNGLHNSSDINLKIYFDRNADSIAQSSELINEQAVQSLNLKDSIFLFYEINNFAEGKNYLIAAADYLIDEDESNNIAFTNFIGVVINEIRNDIIINEFMYAPDAPEPEWIELYNSSGKLINLKNYKLADNFDTTAVIQKDLFISPNEFLIIASDTSISSYFNISTELIIKNFPSLNNTGDKIILIDSLNRTIDSLQYRSTWGGSGGKSLERVAPGVSSTDSVNWKTSKSKNKATPGLINSVTQKEFDVEMTDIVFTPEFPVKGDQVIISAKVKNTGTQSAVFALNLFEDTNLDSVPDNFLTQFPNLQLNSGDSSQFTFNHQVENFISVKAFFVIAIFNADEDTSNNYFYKSVEPGYPSASVLINEIMYTPVGGEPEWIELYNTLNDSINIKGWSISDILTTPSISKINREIYIPAKTYFVVSKDSSITNYHRIIPSKILLQNFAGLNTNADGVVIKDNRGVTIDSMFYRSDWGGLNGFSLERKSILSASNLQPNWSSSKDYENSTPGRINSNTTKQSDLSVTEISFEPRFPALGEDVYISAEVKNFGASASINFVIQFLIDTDSNNTADGLLDSKHITLLNPDDSISVTSVQPIMDLSDKILAAVRIEYTGDEDTLNNYIEKTIQPGIRPGVFIINEIMYDPPAGEPEWIELVNISTDTLNLKNWSVSDILSTPSKNFISNDDLFIVPGEYLIICRDTSFYLFYPEITSKITIVNYGSLSNTSDGVIVYDFRDGIIDSLLYKSSWGGRKGYSLERISITGSTNDSSNWATSLNEFKSTPGFANSFTNIPPAERNQFIINEIMFEPDSDNNEFVELYNTGIDSINIGGWRIEDENRNYFKISETNLVVPPQQYFILAADSSVLLKYNLFEHPFCTNLNLSTLSLSNTGELILLKDVKGIVIDSVFYSVKWHNKNLTSTKNISLERINPVLNANNPQNWSSSVNSFGATPGEQNSVFTANESRETKISVAPNPFSPDNDGFEDFTIINYNLTQPVAQIRIKIYDSQGRLMRTLANNTGSGSSGSIIFDGLDDFGSSLRIGIYIIFLEAINEAAGVVETIKTVVVVARKL